MQSNEQGQREEGRDWRNCHSCSAAPSRTTFSVSLKGQSQSSNSSTHTLVSLEGAVIQIRLCTKPSPALKWRTVTLKSPRAAAIFKLIQVRGRWLGCQTWVPSQLPPDVRSSTAEKGVSCSLFPNNICNSPPLNFLNGQDHSKQHPLRGEGKKQLLVSIWLKIIEIILNKQQMPTEMVTDVITHSYRTLLLYTWYFKVRGKVAIEKGHFKVKITADQNPYNQYTLNITTSNEKLSSGKNLVHMLYILQLSLLTGLCSYCSQPQQNQSIFEEKCWISSKPR